MNLTCVERLEREVEGHSREISEMRPGSVSARDGEETSWIQGSVGEIRGGGGSIGRLEWGVKALNVMLRSLEFI